MDDIFDRKVSELICENAKRVEDHFKADVIFYHGSIHPNFFRTFRDFIENVKNSSETPRERLVFFLRTGGGSAETAERIVDVVRKNYDFVDFVVPDIAMSAGTILCMSGDRIFMDYSSSLGPIDPQIPTPDTGEYIPALGYLDKVEEISQKSKLSHADVVLLKSQDLGRLALIEQARDLSRDLLMNWLVSYKFKNWDTHRTTNIGKKVTEKEKASRAEEIAVSLADHKTWRSHGRNLDVKKLKKLRIEIDDYSDDNDLKTIIREYNDSLTGYIDRMNLAFYIHNSGVQL